MANANLAKGKKAPLAEPNSNATVTRRSLIRSTALTGGMALAGAGTLSPLGSARSAIAQEIELDFMHWGSLFERDVMKNTVSRFNDEHADIRVEQIYTPGDYPTKLNTLAAANELPDVFYQNASDTLVWAEEGRVLELTDYVPQNEQLSNRLPQSFFYFEPGRIGGAMLAGEMATLYFNRDLFDEAGVEYPPTDAATAWTWDQFVETAMLLTIDQEGRNATESDFDAGSIRQFGLTFPRWWICWYPLLHSNGGDITDEAGTTYTLNSPEAVETFQALQDLIHVHHTSPTPTQSENIPATSIQLQSRRTAMVIDGQWALLDAAQSGANFGMGVLPKFQEPLTVFQCNASAINAQTENIDATMEFYLFHNDPAANIEPFAKGLWMPLELKYYEDEEFIKQWTDNEAHPPEYRTAVIDFALNHSVRDPTGTFRNFSRINSRIEAGLDNIWSGEQSAQDALDALSESVQPELVGRFPSS